MSKDEVWMNYTEGDEVRYAKTGQYGIVKAVDEINQMYMVEINGIEYSVSENELN